jgi:hypothetical protein
MVASVSSLLGAPLTVAATAAEEGRIALPDDVQIALRAAAEAMASLGAAIMSAEIDRLP